MKKQIKLLVELVKLREATYTMFEFSTHHVIHKTKCHIKYGREQENCQQYISAPVQVALLLETYDTPGT